MLCEMLLVLISVAEYSGCFLFYFKHSSIYVLLQFKLLKKGGKIESKGEREGKARAAAPQTLPMIVSRVRG